ncbi:hypothetical protein KKG31_08290 [Patescibacteria group bacterium]|nr:hypothetical protein [Patescibacteria group bacterium]MBU1759055.1 hypothetical protein [Patescibacteria group bacterium]
MKNMILLTCVLIFMIGTVFGQIITVKSGGDTIASGLNISGDTTVCNSGSISFTVTFDLGIDHVQWVSNPAGQTFTPSSTNVTVTVTPTVNSSYYVYVYGPGPTNYVGYIRINVIVASLPAVQTVTANGIASTNGVYCTGEAGVIFGLQGSEIGCNYQMQWDGTSIDIGSAVIGTGTAIVFDPVTAGDYQILVTNLSGCQRIIR